MGTVIVFGISGAAVAALLALAWVEHRRGVRFAPALWRRADEHVERLEARLERLPAELSHGGRGVLYLLLHFLALFLSRLGVLLRVLGQRLSARVYRSSKDSTRERGTVSFFLTHIAEHKRELSSRRGRAER